MNCPKCNGHIEVGAQFCPECGHLLAQKKDNHCQFCDTEVKTGQRFCTGCGRSSAEALATPYTCAECQTQLEPAARFCPHCGTTRVSSAEGDVKVTPPIQTEEPKATAPAPAKPDISAKTAPVTPIISGTSTRPRRDFSVVVGEEGDALHWPRAGEPVEKIVPSPPEPEPRREAAPPTKLTVNEPEFAVTAEPVVLDKLEFRTVDLLPIMDDPEAGIRAKRREELQHELAAEVEKERKIQEAKAEYERQLALERAAKKAAEERKAAERESDSSEKALLEKTQQELAIELERERTLRLEQGELIFSEVEHTPETQRSIDELETLIAQLEEKEATLVVAKKPQGAEETPASVKKPKKSKKEKKAKAKDEPAVAVMKDKEQDKPRKEEKEGNTLYTVLFVVIVVALVAVISVSLLTIFRKQNDKLQEQAMSSTTALQQSLQEETEGVANTPSSAAEEEALADEVVESDTKNVVGYRVELAVEPAWEAALPFDELGFARVRQGEGISANMGLITSDGMVYLEPTYDEIGVFSEQLAAVSLDGTAGFIGIDGAVAIPLEFEEAKEFSTGFAAVKKGGKWGYIDARGQETIPFQYDTAESFESDVARVSLDSVAFFINEGGNKKSENYEETSAFSEGFAAVKKGGKWGYIGEDFYANSPFAFDKAAPYSQGYAAVAMEGEEFLIDVRKQVVSPKVEEMFSMTEDKVALAKADGLYGLVDGKSATFLAQPEYLDGRNFSGGFAAVSKIEGTWHYIDRFNQALSTETYAQADDFHNGIARVRVGADFFMIDSKGDIVDSQVWESIGDYSGGMVAVMKGGKWGYLALAAITGTDDISSGEEATIPDGTEDSSVTQEPDEGAAVDGDSSETPDVAE